MYIRSCYNNQSHIVTIIAHLVDRNVASKHVVLQLQHKYADQQRAQWEYSDRVFHQLLIISIVACLKMIGLSSSSDHNHCVLQNVSYQKERKVTLPLSNKYISASKLRSQKWSSKVSAIPACHQCLYHGLMNTHNTKNKKKQGGR